MFKLVPCMLSPARALLLAGLVLLALPHGKAVAQEADTPADTIDFRQALELALERNLSLRQSANEVAANDAVLAQERAGFLPNLNLSAGPSLRFGRAFDQTTAALTDEQSRAFSLSASSSVTLFDGFANLASVREAGRNLDASRNSYARARQALLYQTASEYLQIFLNEDLIDVEEENLAAQQQQLESIQAAYEAGNRPIADVLQQQATIAQTEQRLIAARRDHRLSMMQLKQTLHLGPLAEVTFEAPPDDLLAAPLVDYDAGALIQQALANRDDVTAQRLRIEAAEAGITVARSGYYPSISLNANAGTNYSSLNPQFDFSDQLTDLNRNGSVGLSVSIPIFNRLQTKTAVERAQVTASNEQLALETLEQEVAYDVQQALLDYETAQAQLRAAERQLAAAEESLQAAEARYDVGASTLLEVTQARSVFVEASISRLEAVYTVFLNELGIAYTAGQVDQVLAQLP